MLLGKRTRHPIKRTTSMTGITVSNLVEEDHNIIVQQQQQPIHDDPQNNPFHDFPNPNSGHDPRLLDMVSPRNPGGGSSGFTLKTNHGVDAPFLRCCCLCKRRLAAGRDIYMYRGDTAFCSLECREKQMKQDERKEKPNQLASNKEIRRAQAYY